MSPLHQVPLPVFRPQAKNCDAIHTIPRTAPPSLCCPLVMSSPFTPQLFWLDRSSSLACAPHIPCFASMLIMHRQRRSNGENAVPGASAKEPSESACMIREHGENAVQRLQCCPHPNAQRNRWASASRVSRSPQQATAKAPWPHRRLLLHVTR